MANLVSGSILQQQTRNQNDSLNINDFKKIWSDLAAINAESSGGTGDVFGPASSVDDEIVVYSGTTGKIIKNTGITLADLFSELYPGSIVVNAATTAALAGSPVYDNGAAGVGATLTKGSNGAFPTQDGITSVAGNTYLVKNQATQTQNGVYELTTLGTAGTPWVLTRTTNSDEPSELNAQVVIVGAGTVNKRRIYSQTTATPTIGTNNIVYAQTPAPNMSQYLDKATYDPAALAAQVMVTPISKTVAEMQALSSANSFVPGQLYLITDAAVAQGTCQLAIKAYTVARLEPIGYGLFQNAVMATGVMAEIGYELAADVIKSVYVSYIPGGTYSNVYITDSGGGAIAAWPFDSATITDVVAFNPSIAGAVDGTITGVSMGMGAAISCGAGCTLGNIVKGAGGQISAADPGGNPGMIADCTIGNNSVVLAVGWSIGNTTIGDGRQIDTTAMTPGGSISNKVWIGDYNTIEIDNGDVAANELDMSLNTGIIDMSDFQWAGVLKVLADNGVTPLKSITNMLTNSVVKITNDGTNDGLAIEDTLVGAGNLYLEVSNTTITIDRDYTNLEYISFKYNGTYVMQQNSVIRV